MKKRQNKRNNKKSELTSLICSFFNGWAIDNLFFLVNRDFFDFFGYIIVSDGAIFADNLDFDSETGVYVAYC
jgi:hypothetical protein